MANNFSEQTPYPSPISLPQTVLPGTSRYFGAPFLKTKLPDNREVAYLARRFLPLPEEFDPLTEHVVAEKERPDHVAFNFLNDPELFWRVADANPVLDPNQLTDTPGARITIALPQGIPGVDYA
ncbi:MAG: hypothetical protein WCH39_23535 [Schlesneria sp.]